MKIRKLNLFSDFHFQTENEKWKSPSDFRFPFSNQKRKSELWNSTRTLFHLLSAGVYLQWSNRKSEITQWFPISDLRLARSVEKCKNGAISDFLLWNGNGNCNCGLVQPTESIFCFSFSILTLQNENQKIGSFFWFSIPNDKWKSENWAYFQTENENWKSPSDFRFPFSNQKRKSELWNSTRTELVEVLLLWPCPESFACDTCRFVVLHTISSFIYSCLLWQGQS